MPKIWKVFYGDCLFDLNGTSIGSYDEAFALFSNNRIREWNCHCKGRYDDSWPPVWRSKRRLVKAKDMGSNLSMSRHSGKGLSGRRAQSSGSLYRMLAPRVGRVLNRCGDGVRHRDRNKFCGSLPNHLDEKQAFREVGSGGSPDTLYYSGSTYEKIYLRRPNSKTLGLLFRGQQDPGGGGQGCGLTEWSPEDDGLPASANSSFRRRRSTIRRSSDVAFITKENTFEAKFEKGSRGLGLSVTGGIDTADQHPGLIRIKRIFPHQPAWECGALELGDVILEANGTPLTGLSNHEALEILRTTPSNVVLKICRPPCNTFFIPVTGEDELLPPPPPPKRDPNRNVLSSQCSNSKNKLPLPLAETYGEFDVILKKINGSLGFTLRKEDESILGHYVRALVREPAISDGRIRPGDKIVSVNGMDISMMSHSEAVTFLRQSGDEVELRLYRDPVQTPISALSPTDSQKVFRPRPVLRKEAMDMLSTLAVRKSPKDSRQSGGRSRVCSTSPASSPRRRKLTKNPNESADMPEWKALKFDSLDSNEDGGVVLDDLQREHLPGEREEANSEPVSLPHLPTAMSEFSYKNPVYQSAQPHTVYADCERGKERLSDESMTDSVLKQRGGSQGLLKWKGVVFTEKENANDAEGNDAKDRQSKSQRMLTVELCRGWNSRLGFSLRSSNSKTLISAIYPCSVAAKDGRLQVGDEVIKINDESISGMTTTDVIDLLRKIRGTIEITIIRGNENLSSSS